MKMRKAILKKINSNDIDWVCECGNPVVSAYFDDRGDDEILVTSSVEVCNVCGLIIDEDTIPEDEIAHIAQNLLGVYVNYSC